MNFLICLLKSCSLFVLLVCRLAAWCRKYWAQWFQQDSYFSIFFSCCRPRIILGCNQIYNASTATGFILFVVFSDLQPTFCMSTNLSLGSLYCCSFFPAHSWYFTVNVVVSYNSIHILSHVYCHVTIACHFLRSQVSFSFFTFFF